MKRTEVEAVWRFLQQRYSLEEIAEKCGLHPYYVRELATGRKWMTHAARWRLLVAFPEAAPFLLPEGHPLAGGS